MRHYRRAVSGVILSITTMAAVGGGSAALTAVPSSAASSSSVYKISTANCTDPAAVTKVIKGTLTVGWSGPFSGPIAPFASALVQGAQDRFAFENQKGGIKGVRIAIQKKDDQYNPANAKANFDQFIAEGNVDVGTLFGPATVAAIAGDQELACLPTLFATGAADSFKNIKQYPWFTNFLPSSAVEGAVDAGMMKAAFPGKKTITVGVAEDQAGGGAVILSGLQSAIKGSNIKIVSIAPLTDPNAAAITLKAANPEVVFDAGVVPECIELTAAVAKLGWSPKLFIQPSNCSSAALMFAPAGVAANGQKVAGWEMAPSDPVFANTPQWTAYTADATKVDPSGAQVNNTYYETGWIIADMMVNIFHAASKSKLGLSRAGIMQAARNQNYHPPLFLSGINWIMNAKEAWGFTKMQPFTFNSTTGSFDLNGKIVDGCTKVLSRAVCSTSGL